MQTQDPKTCRIYSRGNVYFHKRRKTLVTVPKDYVHVVCDECEYMVALPLRRYSIDEVEQIRAQHVKYTHFSALVNGTMQIHNIEPFKPTLA